MIRNAFSFFFLSMIASLAHAAPPSGNDLVKTEMIAEVEGIKAGRPFLVGVHFKIEPHWHIYWTNPGDAGTPTELKFDLPEGWAATDIQYPVPERFTSPGDIVSYGYQNETMLIATITPPTKLPSKEPVKIVAKANWLVCDKVCLPGSGTAELTLPVSTSMPKRNSESGELIRKWWDRTPRSTSEVGVNPTPGFDEKTGDYIIRIMWPKEAPQNVEWFPPPSDALAITDIRVVNDGKWTVVHYRMQTIGNKTAPANVPKSALAYDGLDGRRGLAIQEFAIPNKTGSGNK